MLRILAVAAVVLTTGLAVANWAVADIGQGDDGDLAGPPSRFLLERQYHQTMAQYMAHLALLHRSRIATPEERQLSLVLLFHHIGRLVQMHQQQREAAARDPVAVGAGIAILDMQIAVTRRRGSSQTAALPPHVEEQQRQFRSAIDATIDALDAEIARIVREMGRAADPAERQRLNQQRSRLVEAKLKLELMPR